MQVSWIDADDLKALLARIEPAAPEAPAPRPRDPIPSVDPGMAASFLIATDPFAEETPAPPAGQPASQAPVARGDSASPARLTPETAIPDEAGPEAPPPDQGLPSSTTSAGSFSEGGDPESADTAQPLSRMRDKLRAIRQRAHEAGILSRGGDTALPAIHTMPVTCSTGAAPAPPAPQMPVAGLPRFETPSGTRQQRLEAFARWTRPLLENEDECILIVNDNGELLWGSESKARLAMSAVMAWSARLRGNAALACGSLPVLHQTLASGQKLTAIPCETLTGPLLHAAVLTAAPLPDEIAMQVRQGLIRAAGASFA